MKISELTAMFRGNGVGNCNSATPDASQKSQPVMLQETHQRAAARMVDFATIKTVKHRNKKLKTHTGGSHPEIVRFARALVDELEARGIPFYAFEFYRDPKRQDELYSRGVSKARAGKSPHQHGCAVDLIHSVKLWDLEPTYAANHKAWAVIGAIGKEVARRKKIPIQWGGDFRSLWDPAHWELAHWRGLRDARARLVRRGVRLPENDRLCFDLIDAEYERFRKDGW